MAMGTRETDQPPLWIATSDLPTSPGHPFYARLTTLLDGHHFDRPSVLRAADDALDGHHFDRSSKACVTGSTRP